MTPVLSAIGQDSPEAIYFPIFQPAGDFIVQQFAGVAGLADTQLVGADGLLVSDFPGDSRVGGDVLLRSEPCVRRERQCSYGCVGQRLPDLL